MHRRVFNDLWLFQLAPASLLQPLARLRGINDVDELRSVKGQQATAYNQPAESRLSFARFIEAEARLPARGRYTFIHLLVPHRPFLLSPDCSYRSALDRTDIQQQSACAMRLASDLLETLRRLGRYDDTAILIQGDHGSPVKPENGHATPDDPSGWWRALLMVKAPRAHGALRTSQERATLCDVAPTLLAAVGLKPTSPVDGRVLADAVGATSASDRTLE
jgi:Sulfatase